MTCKLFLALALSSVASLRAATTNESLLGFTPAGAERERSLEAKFDAVLRRENLRDWMKFMTARPHHLGSPYGKQVAEFIAEKFKSWGYETEIEQFDVLFPTPKMRLLEMTAPEKFRARLEEPELPEDSTSKIRTDQLPPYNAYSIDGDVSGALVYVNYGLPRDYEALAGRGIDVTGKIVIARYGNSWRGVKVKVAGERGAVGCIIYSDPADDGYHVGDVYPTGAWRNEFGAQRGSVADMPVYSGDPLTPGVGATKDAKRVAIKDAATLTKIPVLPISYSDALPLLRSLSGPVAPAAWRGALPITSHLGPGPATVHLKVEFNWNQTPCYDVIAKMRGAERPDEWIIRGNHHDAWVFGADDPISGTISVMEEARATSELAKSGWKPRRTIIFTAWDGEEPGLIGSTEWVETHADLLKDKAAVYINGDHNSRGSLHVGGSHTLEKFINEIARDVMDPDKKISAAQRLVAYRTLKGSEEERRDLRERTDFRISALGSGSDYTPFLQHLGIASVDIRYFGDEGGGSYHSVYDSFDHYTRFLDSDFEYGIVLAKTSGRAVLRLANADTLPFEFNNFAETIGRYVREIVKLCDDLRDETIEQNRLITDKTFEFAHESNERLVVPKTKAPVPFLNFAPLQNAAGKLRDSARKFETARKAIATAGLSPEIEARLDGILMKTERALIREQGLPRRPWYKHQIYAPGFYTGYGVKTLPGVREAVEERNWKEAEEQILIAARTLENCAAEIDRARELISR